MWLKAQEFYLSAQSKAQSGTISYTDSEFYLWEVIHQKKILILYFLKNIEIKLKFIRTIGLNVPKNFNNGISFMNLVNTIINVNYFLNGKI